MLPRDTGKLAWEVNVFAAGQSDAGVQLSDGLYYLDAVSADLLEVRPTTAELAAPSVFSKLLSKGSPKVSRRLSQMVLASLDAPEGPAGRRDRQRAVPRPGHRQGPAQQTRACR